MNAFVVDDDADDDVWDGAGKLLCGSRALPAAFGCGVASGEVAGVTFSRLYLTTSLGRTSGEVRTRGGFGEVGSGDAAALARRVVRTSSGGGVSASSERGARRGERRGGVATEGPGVRSAMRSSVDARSSTAALVPGVIPGLASSASSSGPRWLRRSIATGLEHRGVPRVPARRGWGTRKQRLFRGKSETARR